MKTIFDVLDHNMKCEGADSEKMQPIYRIHYNDDGRLNKIMLTTESPFGREMELVRFPQKQAVMLTFHEREPGVISSRKNKAMDMMTAMVMRDTYIPKNLVVRVEVLEAAHDMADVVQTLSGLRKSIEDAATKSSLILEK